MNQLGNHKQLQSNVSLCFVHVLGRHELCMYSAGVYVLVVTAKTKLVCSCMDTPGDILFMKQQKIHSGGFRAARLPGQVTPTAEPLCHMCHKYMRIKRRKIWPLP